jgi:FkbM family methyltransferase
MLIKWEELVNQLNVRPKGVMHVGAHLGEEKEYYEASGMLPVHWIEAREDLVREMQKFLLPPQHYVEHALLWRESNVLLKMNVASNSQSSSILPLADHRIQYPHINYVGTIEMRTKTLDDLLDDGIECEMIVLDLQGAELEVLKGLTGMRWAKIKWIYTEIFTKELYENCARLSEIDTFLAKQGFRRIFTRMQRDHGWGDAIYSSESRLMILSGILELRMKEDWKKLKFKIWKIRTRKSRK